MKGALRALFDASFERFLDEEQGNILNGVSERNLCGRLALNLEMMKGEFDLQGYYVDIEYNRNQNGRVKTIIDGHFQIVPITCDIILHSRGEIVARDNLMAIEMKKSTRPMIEKERDKVRLTALTKVSYNDVWSADGKTLPEHVCGYAIGLFIELDISARSFKIEEYRAGHLNRVLNRNF
jgi:hypothetical protein